MRTIIISLFISILLGLGGPKAIGQLPVTEVWMLELDNSDKIEEVSLLSNFNPKSYNNQAVFMDDDNILMTAEIDKGNTDIVILNHKKEEWKRLTKTLENEYSPRAAGRESITTVRVEQDGTSQVLWEYPKNASNSGQIVLDKYSNIGYYHPLSNLKLALFVIDKTTDLHIINSRNERVESVTKDIGRCFQVKKSGELLFIKKGAQSTINSFNPVNKKSQTLHIALDNSEDFVLYGPAEIVLMARGSQIYRYNPTSAGYILMWDLSKYGIKAISRMDYRDGKLLLINTP